MKKSLLLLAALFVSSMGFAQWTAPVPSSTVEMDDSGTAAQFLYNVKGGGFFAGHNDWNTRASIATKGDTVRFIKLYEDEEQTVELGTWNFGCYPNTYTDKNKWLYVSANAWDAAWVDASNAVANTAYPGTDGWIVEKQGNGTYKFTNDDVTTGTYFGVAEIFRGEKGNTRCYFLNTTDEWSYVENDEEIPGGFSFTGEFWDEWVFITPAEYEALQPKVEQYRAAVSLASVIENAKKTNPSYDYSVVEAVYNNTASTLEELNAASGVVAAVLSLKAELDKAKAEYPTVNFSTVESVYNNTASTAKELDAAKAEITVLVGEYLATLATYDNPADMTSLIGDGSKVDPWTQTFTGEGTTGSHTTNTWSTEANNGADGTDMTTPFIEHWTGSGGKLSDQKIFQKIGLAPGLYKFTVNVRVYNEASKLDAFEGLYMFFGNDTINLQNETPVFYSGSKSVLWSKDKFTIIAIVEEAGDIELGFEIKGANFNWLAFKQTSLTYYGNEDVVANSIKLAKAAANYEKLEDVAANPTLVQAYNDAVDAFDAAASVDEVKSTIDALKSAKATIDENIEAYKTLYAKFDTWNEYLIINEGLDGDNWNAFCDFIEMGEEVEGYPTPTPMEMKENADYPLLTDEINDYIFKVDSLYSYAVATSLTPGADCTDMIENPSFATGDFTGWTYKEGKLGDKNVECYEQVVDIYQVVKDVPDGIYSVSVQAFERPAGNKNYDGSEPSKVFLFMNDFQTPVMNIVKDAIPEAEAVDSVNCLIHSGDVQAPDWPCDYLGTTDGYEWGYVPNSVTGARFAFEAGRYTQKVYGLVEGGEMKLGLTSNGVKAHWVLWANFKLIYEGKTEESLLPVLEGLIETMDNLLNDNADGMNNTAAAALQDAISAASEVYKSTDVDVLWAGVIAANKAVVDTRASINAYAAFSAAMDELNETADANYDNACAKGQQAYEEMKDATADDLTMEELEALTAKVKDAIALLSIPKYEEASDDAPVDMTTVIVNNGFEAGNISGWTNSGTIDAQSQNNDSFDNKQGTYYGEKWHVNGTVDINQTLAHLPAGTYELTAYAYSTATDCILYANGISVPVTETSGLYTVVVKLAADGDPLKIGVSWSDTGDKWTCMDEFTLTYYGAASAKEETSSTDIEGVDSSAAVTPVAIYTISGVKVDAMQKGLNIVKFSDGSTKKILK